jgi:hypothetical protein
VYRKILIVLAAAGLGVSVAACAGTVPGQGCGSCAGRAHRGRGYASGRVWVRRGGVGHRAPFIGSCGDRAAFEAPLQPPQLVMRNMLEQLDRRPAGRQPAAAQLAVRQGLKLAHQPGAEVLQVPEEDLGARGHRIGGLGEWQAHEASMPHPWLLSPSSSSAFWWPH